MDRLLIIAPPAQPTEARGSWLAQTLSIILAVCGQTFMGHQAGVYSKENTDSSAQLNYRQ